MTLFLLDVASYQGDLSPDDVVRAGFGAVNLKISHGLGSRSVHPGLARWVAEARRLGLGISTFHFLDGSGTGADQAVHAYNQLVGLGLAGGTAHQCDCESTATEPVVREYLATMGLLLGRPVALYTGDWWWQPRGWDVSALTDYLWAAPNAGYLGAYPGDTSPHWQAGYAGWAELAVMQYAVAPLIFPDGSRGTIDVSKSAIRNPAVWTALTGGAAPMAMDPRTHPRGAAPNFSMDGLPANPNPQRITNALWWLVCMRERLEPASQNGGVLALKPGYHSYGSRLPDHGLGDTATDHSIRRAPDRAGQWWQNFAAAHDWTFPDAQQGDYRTINKYCNRLRNAMRDPADLRPDDVYAYFIGQIDTDRTVEGYNEYRDDEETGDDSHLWHRHDSFRRNIVGNFLAMWKALTIDMGWTYTEWQRSVAEGEDVPLTEPEYDKIAAKVAAKLAADMKTPTSGLAVAARAAAWQYVGGGIPAGMSTLKVLNDTYTNGAALLAAVAALRAENATLEAATGVLVQKLLDLVAAGGGDLDAAPILARLDAMGQEVTAAAHTAGEQAARQVLDRLAAAQDAEAAALRGE